MSFRRCRRSATARWRRFLRGELSFPEAVDAFKRNTRRYVKRQLTWFRTDERIRWLDITRCDPAEVILEELGRRGIGRAKVERR